MKLTSRHIAYIFFSVFAVSLFVMSFSYFPDGYVGTTRKGGVNLGCICHGDSAASNVSVFITGPDSVAAGQTATFMVHVAHGPAITGGFNVASASDTSSLYPVAGDTMVRKQDGELTHTHPKPFGNDTVSWEFRYTAPGTPQADTLFASGNSTNNSLTSDSDKWNWSENLVVRVYNPIGIINLSTLASDFSISQNYPNPFNPATQIRFSVARSSDIKIKIYDMLGNVIAEPVSGNMKAGTYSVDFDASGFSSGTYFYSLIANGKRMSTKKMLLIK